ncbi:MAG: tRNA lysidine(34) synthetase TilS, partial [Legionellales bacterium]
MLDATLWVGYSGGLDSSVLLHLLSQSQYTKIKAIHINHNISKFSADWQQHCVEFCNKLNISLICVQASVTLDAGDGPENAARKARYQAFKQHIAIDDVLLLAHHLQDQAETVLLRLFRGAGVKGLAAMQQISNIHGIKVVRPLLTTDKTILTQYAMDHKIKYIDD